ncbi:D-glycero-beta-D-manno-heptose-7-phosphate kinase [Candidatus Omnitrophota bacterium]
MMLGRSKQSEKMKAKFVDVIKQFKKAKILVIGDIILDEFIWGKVNRISPEAPVPVVNVERESFMPGGSLNVANNIRTLKGNVYPAGIVGRDLRGRMLVRLMKKDGVEIEGIIYDESRPTTLKTRIIAHSQQVVRFDRENKQSVAVSQKKKLLHFIKKKIKEVDCVVIEDYGKGVIVPDLIKEVIKVAKEYKKHILVDPKEEHFSYYKGVTSITPNYKEALSACGFKNGENVKVETVGKKLLKQLALSSVLLTLGEQGMVLFEKNGDITKIPTAAQEVFDVSGAGDTVIAVFAMALAVGVSLKEAAILANIAAGIVVGKVGTACISQKELIDAIKKS